MTDVVTGIVGWIVEPYRYEFMRAALAALVLISVVSAVVGAFVVHKGLAFLGDALAHSTLAGVAIAFVAGGTVSVGALIAAAVTALGIGWTQRRAGVSYDTAIGILFVGMFSIGILVLSLRSGYTPDLFSFVFGNILGVSTSDLVGAAILTVLVLLFVAAFYRDLVFVAYDPAMATASGLPVAAFQYAILLLIGVAVVVALKAIGIVLVNAMLIIPAATSSLVATRLPGIVGGGLVVALAASVVGLHVSYYVGVAASPAIVLVACLIFAVALAYTSWRARRMPEAARVVEAG